ncbi:MAG: ABC transporter permease [Polyangiaceae bacterium]|nr:ABC transporter permease [Polyangiaceae bacterium]
MTGPNLRTMAWRNLGRNRRRTAITVASIALGAFLAVLFTALQDRSFADFIDTAARLGGGHVTVQHVGYLDTPSLTRTVGDVEPVQRLALKRAHARHAAPRITGQALVASADDNVGAMLVGYDPAQDGPHTLGLLEGLRAGRLFATAHDDGVILGKTLAERLRVNIGDRVVYTLTDKQGELTSGMGRLVGIVSVGTPSLDGGLLLVPIDTLRRVLGYGPREATMVAIFLADSRSSSRAAAQLNRHVGPGLKALTWSEVRPELNAFIAMKVGGARFMELVILALIAAGIFNTLLVSVMERAREFGIMMAIGFSRGQLFRLVVWESLWLGLLGLLAGGLATVGPYFYLARNGVDLSTMTGSGGAEIAGVGFDPHVRVGIFPENLVAIAVIILLVTVVTGLYPAGRAGRLEPVAAIKLV